MAAALIRVAGLTLRYPNGRLALDGVGLSVAAGEFVVVLGANGSGKSTMLRCIAGILRPTAGRIEVADLAITGQAGRSLANARMAIGMIFQQPCLVRRRSVLANVMTGTLGRHRTIASALGRLPASEQPHALACLDEVGLRNLATQRAGTLSGGQAQRVSIARALAQRPRALLADEPVASLDPQAAQDIMRLLRRASRQDGLAVICVLHQPDIACCYADRIVGLREGRVMFDAAAAGLPSRSVAGLYERAAG